ncbi:MAG: hypothetical protein ABI759_29070 [Candidatus Solibacter sp.]
MQLSTPIDAGRLVAYAVWYAFYLIEFLVLAVLVRRAFSRRSRVPMFPRAFETLARQRTRAVVVTGLTALVARALLLPVLPVRQPVITDEFSYLLAADTFASGRLTNPTHPMWGHFESMHTMQHPTYAAMHHPAQGLILAAGKVMFGHPWAGVCVSVALMCALLTWMLQGWLPPAWALLGGLLGVLRLGLYGYWVNSYWGGAAAAIGGLLVLGAMPRLLRGVRTRDAVLLAVGLVILAHSRPYEGLLVAAPVCVYLAVGLGRRRAIARAAIPAGLVLALAAAGTCYYYWRVTGNPLRMPYQEARDQYATARIFLWEKPNPAPHYPFEAMRAFYLDWELVKFLEAKTLPGLVHNTIGKTGAFWMFFLGPALALPLLFGWRLILDRRVRPLLVTGGICAAGFAVNTWFYAHYAAPMTGLIYALVLQGMRHLRARRAAGAAVARAVVWTCVGMAALRACAQPLSFYMPPDWPMTWYYTRPGNVQRARVLRELESMPGPQLAIVRYRPGHNFFEEWVYNAASIDAAKVVWAHEMGSDADAGLLRYFSGRQVWLVDADARPAQLTKLR